METGRRGAGADLSVAAEGPSTAVAPPVPNLLVRLLGEFCVEADGRLLSGPLWRRERVRSLMAMLALARSASRRSLSADLWPDHDAASASNNLRVTLSYLRRAFQEAAVSPMPVESDRHSVWLTSGIRWSIDTEEFERCVADLPAAGVRLDHLATGHPGPEDQVIFELSAAGPGAVLPSPCDPLWTQAVSWYRGDFLSGLDVPAELEIERERLRTLFVAAAVRLGEHLLESRQTQAAFKVASSAVVADPWSEPAGVLMVRCQVGLGDRSGALRSLERCLGSDAELGVSPSEELRMLIETLGA